MGEIICDRCGYVNPHLYCHKTGKCKACGARITYCDSCNEDIKLNDDI